jgi:hypothetical protein
MTPFLDLFRISSLEAALGASRAVKSNISLPRPACSYCGFCQGFGCHIGAGRPNARPPALPSSVARMRLFDFADKRDGQPS